MTTHCAHLLPEGRPGPPTPTPSLRPTPTPPPPPPIPAFPGLSTPRPTPPPFHGPNAHALTGRLLASTSLPAPSRRPPPGSAGGRPGHVRGRGAGGHGPPAPWGSPSPEDLQGSRAPGGTPTLPSTLMELPRSHQRRARRAPRSASPWRGLLQRAEPLALALAGLSRGHVRTPYRPAVRGTDPAVPSAGKGKKELRSPQGGRRSGHAHGEVLTNRADGGLTLSSS